MRRSAVLTFVVVLMWAWAAAHPVLAQTGEVYTARLGWVPLAGPNDRQYVSGKGSVSATLTGMRLAIAGTFEGLPAPVTVARLHRGIIKGARGPAMGDLMVMKTGDGTAGTISGNLTLTTVDVEQLKAGRLYVQVHSEKGLPKDDGSTLWGWLLK
jgi:hypothetical protein